MSQLNMPTDLPIAGFGPAALPNDADGEDDIDDAEVAALATAVGDSDVLPGRIFIVRHGERLDHVMRTWCTEHVSDRLHDTPLTDVGRQQGTLFGAHVLDTTRQQLGSVEIRGDEFFTVVSSPLVRACDTAHHIAEVLGVGRLLIDEAMIEVGWYMEDRLREVAKSSPTVGVACRDFVLGNTVNRRELRTKQGATVKRVLSTRGDIVVPHGGVALSRDVLRTIVSPLVCVKYLGIHPAISPVVQCASTGRLRRSNGEEVCCVKAAVRGAKALACAKQRAALPSEWRRGAQHTLILVGHGDSIHAWCKALTGNMKLPFPSPFEFNCFVELHRNRAPGTHGLYQLASPYFGTGHLKGQRARHLAQLAQRTLAPTA
jgi:phosphohistidine phosphatase SixA